MKRSLFILAVLTFSSLSWAQSDSLVIHFKSGAKRTIALADIRKITFDSLKSAVSQPLQTTDASLVYPNPSSNGTTIGFTITDPGSVDIAIYDAEGKRIRLIKTPQLGTGYNEIFWDGLDERNARVAAGTYLCEIRSKGKLQISKLIVIRK